MSAWGSARRASAWMDETNREPMMPTPTGRMVTLPRLGLAGNVTLAVFILIPAG